MSIYHQIQADEAFAKLDAFHHIIDVRTPLEYAEDHIPGALNWPVLTNEERVVVGTLYRQDPLEARKVGAAMVARNIAQHLDAQRPLMQKHWRPLVYCWRGGQRSGSMNWFLNQIGFKSLQLVGGYKAFRGEVLKTLADQPRQLRFVVLCGRTGTGKTRLLGHLAAQGEQVLDLEGLARHRGSVLGALPDAPQPTQKAFDTALWQTLSRLDPQRPVFVESESRKIGSVQLPEPLHQRLREHGQCIWISMEEAGRVQLLLEDYAHFQARPDAFGALLEGLVSLRGRERVRRWQAQATQGQWAQVFAELMRDHYDPGYERSLTNHFPQLATAPQLLLRDGSEPELARAAADLRARFCERLP
ncbi:tRNA 2-selenouridine(34) synthase MnmH [Roseateles terrae]|uniref:tRNA 2-selenouridine synthase n=1 Tax=Roseateles terrae TaxID=431060 RepID=A0ABR6GM62_9BURK|nr:tRNA 2-selenouridine(34) synthase MnmH [Roseateles terrae]MBB3192762.1 tRNA 2-selenouridine synthase [Roseateles terrae]OWQ89961.1 tRNA 2-selenouridine(34) synthase MnmH [Roseateles terrae]